VILYRNGLCNEIKAFLVPVMASCAQVNALGNAAIGTNSYGRQIIDPNVFAYPRMIADLQAPRELDTHTLFDIHVLSNLRAKRPEQSDF
jgi:hypothetical protein